ncbi:MAG: nicotinate phosphoribosyltransferase [Spirochaetales bacterium]|jgi:nicotinate phosphoribosyltransferase|nr:nicotinate phosphoribosyltransferase [Spirochaetales bacterium]
MITSALFTDLYELTMAQGYFHYDMNARVVFDMFFRRQPFGGGFSIFAGLDDLLTTLKNFRFSGEDLAYLESLKTFRPDFLRYLEGFRFSGDVYAMEEGTPIFPQEPLLRIHGSLIETQIIESMLLNLINFQSLIATKTARIYLASRGGTIMEFGMRRAQGSDGAMSASRAAYIGGAASTSNTLAGRVYGIPVSGTMAHSWIMAFDSEEEAFERYASLYPNATAMLIDTYNTIRSGVPHAIKIGKKLQALGKPVAVRLDSGDMQYLSGEVRKALDAAGLPEMKIAVSNELDEEIIEHLVAAKSPIDLWGVGTRLVTGGKDSSFTGVYKLAAREKNGAFQPTMKVSDNPEKSTNPGIKQVYRFHDGKGSPLADLIAFEGEQFTSGEKIIFHHPFMDYRHFSLEISGKVTPLLEKKMENGEIIQPPPPLADIRRHTLSRLENLDPTYTRILNPHVYKVSLSEELGKLKVSMIEEMLSK